MTTILAADDDRDIIELLRDTLLPEGFSVIACRSGEEALTSLGRNKIDLAIIDWMMPGMDGLELCRQIRMKWNIPVLFLSARASDVDKVIGLGSGADDYMTKPFSPLELTARVKAQLRRFTTFNTSGINPAVVTLHGVAIHPDSRAVQVGEQPVKLTKTEYDILLLLASNRGRVFTLEEIFAKVWKDAYYESNNTVMVHLSRLREKLKKSGSPDLIQNVWGVGYKIEA
ncbi:response regulator transcription factor [Paenibacillus tarimensis]|uniref:response regulator transcription factor n=1 Tax=Paenibacillus tarimensis TaxID=416012 RepID=UPI001F1E3155|nr:response regulator transcription factor [Paenibacillus tarimensis]MCF2944556.1 response regulator transcription factor [Paenibacillus tarimensis]